MSRHLTAKTYFGRNIPFVIIFKEMLLLCFFIKRAILSPPGPCSPRLLTQSLGLTAFTRKNWGSILELAGSAFPGVENLPVYSTPSFFLLFPGPAAGPGLQQIPATEEQAAGGGR